MLATTTSCKGLLSTKAAGILWQRLLYCFVCFVLEEVLMLAKVEVGKHQKSARLWLIFPVFFSIPHGGIREQGLVSHLW